MGTDGWVYVVRGVFAIVRTIPSPVSKICKVEVKTENKLDCCESSSIWLGFHMKSGLCGDPQSLYFKDPVPVDGMTLKLGKPKKC